MGYEAWRAGWDSDATAVTSDGGAWTYGELHERVRRACGWLAERDVGAGDVVALAMDKQPEWLVIALAAIRSGAVLLPLNERYTARELELPLCDAPAKLAVLPDGRAEAISGPWTAAAASEAIAGIAGAPPRDPPPAARTRAAPALLLYTSGTTGRPKGVPLSTERIDAGVDALHAAWRWSARDVLLHVLPPYHVHGLIVAAFGALRAGATQLWLPRFDPRDVIERLASGPATVFMAVPTLWSRMLEVEGDRDLRRVRLATSGSAGLPASVHAEVRRRFGLSIVERYGMTEIGIVVSNPIDDPRPGTIGLPLPGVTVRIVDDAGADVPDGETGELWVRAPQAFAGYHRLPEATADAIQGGFVRTGDLGRREPDGRLVLVGRRSELVIVGGFNVYPAEVEEALLACPGIREAMVYGEPDADLGEVPAAAVVADGPLDVDAVRLALRERLAAYKIPRRIHAVDALPRNAMGKLVRAGQPAPG
jgi:malonyl-CoA/methylmalonyl-CoA synthetase